MSNQLILWSMLILPWLTLIFMKKDEIKRYMPVALFTAATSAIIIESGATLGLWAYRETAYPIKMISYNYGIIPVITMWIFKFTFKRFWVYLAVNAVFDIGFAYLMLPWLVSRGIFDFVNSRIVLFITIPHSILLYVYQKWQEGELIRLESKNLQPAAAKQLFKYGEDKNNLE